MAAMKVSPELFSDLEFRGIVKQVTDPTLKDLLSKSSVTLYCGFDPTSDSLHIGSLLPLLTLRRFQLAGHRVIAVVGGATGMIGDPSGKSQERSLLGPDHIAQNLKGITTVISKFLDLKGSNPALVLNNGDWFKGLSYLEFLRDVGKHFTVNHMMAKESVRARLEDREHGISYTEFSYMLLQAYDFYVLHEKQGCRLQIGGSDQWGNITAGNELIRRMGAAHGKPVTPDTEVFGLTHPLVSKSDGAKFGKTEKGNIWLDSRKTSPYQFYQFLVRTADADVMNLIKFFSFLSEGDIRALEAATQKEPEKRAAQTALARELTLMVHGPSEVDKVEKASQALFGTGIRDLDKDTLLDVMGEAPSTEKSKSVLSPGYPLVDALADSGLCQGKGAARKDITAGGIYINNERASDAALLLTSQHLIAGSYVVLRKGKKTYHLMSFK